MVYSDTHSGRRELPSPRTGGHREYYIVANHRVYYKGEGDGLPSVRAMVSLVSLKLPMARPSTKSAPIMH
jgi:hypothetical protein